MRTKLDAALDHETKSSYTVTVSVRDSKDNDGTADEVTDDMITVTIQVANLNEAPVFPTSETGMRSVDENTGAGMNIGVPIAATDDDKHSLTYSLDDSIDADSFSIDASSGQLLTKAALDYETTPSYTVTVTADGPVRRGRQHHGHHHRQQRRGSGHGHAVVDAAHRGNPADRYAGRSRRRRQWQRHLGLGGFPERQLLLDPHQWGNCRLLYAGCRRCNSLPAGHRHLRRWRARAKAPKRSRPIGCSQRRGAE